MGRDAHPSEYTLPLYHIQKKQEKASISIEDAIKASKINPTNKDMIKIKLPYMEDQIMDKAYECTGIDCMVHYLKNYNPPGVVRIKCTLYEGPA